MHLMHLRCFFGRHDWYDVANEVDGYESRVCSRCQKRQWRIENDKDKTWINGRLPLNRVPLVLPAEARIGVSARSIESYRVICQEDPGLTREETGLPQ